MNKNGLIKKHAKKPNSLTKADKNAQKADNLINRDFSADAPNKKYVTDITEFNTKEGKLYTSALFDCFNNDCISVSMDTNMERWLPINMVKQASARRDLRGSIIHTDRGSQYTSFDYKDVLLRLGIKQSMNSAAGRCHDNAKCESMWARAKDEILSIHDISKKTIAEAKEIIFYYFQCYWSNTRICSAIGGMSPKQKLLEYEKAAKKAVA